jgi:iron complex outermembrane receptor protein
MQLNASPASAQESMDGGAPAASQEDGGLQEIVVTAQRREESLQKAAIAVSAVSGDAIINRGVTNTDQLSKIVPALQIQPTGGSNVSIYIRGVGAAGTGPNNENAIAFAVDGVFAGRPSGTVGNFFDLERVEVLKGPQGTLYGRNSTGGAINLVTRKPKLGEFGGNLLFEYGNYNAIKAQAAVNLPVGENAALRVAGQIVHRDGYLSDGYDDEIGQAIRAQLLFRPDDRLSVRLSGSYFNQEGIGAGSVLLPDATVPLAAPPEDRIGSADPRSRAVIQARFPAQFPTLFLPTDDGFNNGEYWDASAEINYDLGFATLTAIPAYRRSKTDFVAYRPGFYNSQTNDDEQFSGELRLASPAGDRFNYVLGLFYFDQDQASATLNKQAAANQAQVLFDISTKSWAAFGQASYAVFDGFRLVAGARYTKEKKVQALQLRSPTTAVPEPAYTGFGGSTTFDKLTWKAGFEFDAGARSLIYANVATGFKSGGLGQYSATRPDLNIFRPETLTAYTVGSKNRFFDNRVQANVEAFYWDYRDQQLPAVIPRIENPATTGQRVLNVGKARFYGVDAEFQVAVGRKGTFSFNVQYLNSKYSEFRYDVAVPGAVGAPRNTCVNTQIATTPVRQFTIDCGGKPAVNAPKWSLTAGYQQEFALSDDLNLIASVSSQYQTSRYLSVEYTPQELQGSVMSSDASLTLEMNDGALSLTAFINNIEDEVIRNQVFQRTIQGTTSPAGPEVVYYTGLRAPRTYGLRLGAKF